MKRKDSLHARKKYVSTQCPAFDLLWQKRRKKERNWSVMFVKASLNQTDNEGELFEFHAHHKYPFIS